MAKNKDRKRKAGHRSGGEAAADARFAVPPEVAGIAAAALKQVNAPAFQHLIAGALGAAGQAVEAMARRAATAAQETGSVSPERPAPPRPPEASVAPAPPAPPAPPIPPEEPVAPEPQAAYRPNFETPPISLPPEAARAIERVAETATQAIEQAAAHASRTLDAAATALERWAEERGRSPDRSTG